MSFVFRRRTCRPASRFTQSRVAALAAAYGGMRLQARQQFAIVDTVAALIASGLGAEIDDAACPPRTGALRVYEPPHRHALRDGATTVCHEDVQRLNVGRCRAGLNGARQPTT